VTRVTPGGSGVSASARSVAQICLRNPQWLASRDRRRCVGMLLLLVGRLCYITACELIPGVFRYPLLWIICNTLPQRSLEHDMRAPSIRAATNKHGPNRVRWAHAHDKIVTTCSAQHTPLLSSTSPSAGHGRCAFHTTQRSACTDPTHAIPRLASLKAPHSCLSLTAPECTPLGNRRYRLHSPRHPAQRSHSTPPRQANQRPATA
jgi:hypothetical protein